MKTYKLWLLLSCLALGACGQPGPLYLENEPVAVEATGQKGAPAAKTQQTIEPQPELEDINNNGINNGLY